MKTFTLNSGDKMPAIGLGTYQAEKVQLEQVIKEIRHYQHIDCAPIYGNQSEIGNLIKGQSIWVTSKLWNSDHHPDAVLPAIKKTLQQLQVDCLDLYLIHWPITFAPLVGMPEKESDFLKEGEIPLTATWQAMEELVSQGLTRNIGVSNFSIRHLSQLLSQCKIKPAVNQVECHPYLAQVELHDFCLKNTIHLTAYSPLGAGKSKTPILLENTTIKAIAQQHQKTSAQIILAWNLQRGISVIPKSTHPMRMQENLSAVNIQLTEKEMEQIHQLNLNHRYVDLSFFASKNSTFKASEVWA